MPQLKTKINMEQDIETNGEYEILSVENFTNADGQKGLKVSLKSVDESDKRQFATILWKRDTVGIYSKLGAFIVALAGIDTNGNPKETSTDEWIGKKIRVLSWKTKERKIVCLD